MRAMILAALAVPCAVGCGGDDETTPPPQCEVEVVLTGGYDVNASGTSCNGAAGHFDQGRFVLYFNIPNGGGTIRWTLFDARVGNGTEGITVDAGVLVEGKTPDKIWAAGTTDGSACKVTIDDDRPVHPEDPHGELLLKGHVESCVKALLPAQPGDDPVTVVKLRGAGFHSWHP